jgi:hypothetical protein
LGESKRSQDLASWRCVIKRGRPCLAPLASMRRSAGGCTSGRKIALARWSDLLFMVDGDPKLKIQKKRTPPCDQKLPHMGPTFESSFGVAHSVGAPCCPAAACRCSTVRFAPIPESIVFHSKLSPSCLSHLGHLQRPNQSTLRARPKPALRQLSSPAHQALNPGPGTKSLHNLEESCWPSDNKTCAQWQAAQDKASGQGWQLVRRPKWWRRVRNDHHTSQQSFVAQIRCNKFKALCLWRCFNCLALDHQCAQCRDPKKCWR